MHYKKVLLVLALVVCLTACEKSSVSDKQHTDTALIFESNVTDVSYDETVQTTEKREEYEIITIMPECGSSIGFSITLPTDWKYDCVMTEDDPTSKIVVSLYPKDLSDTNEKIRIEYSQGGYGICGTMLEEKSIDFNGIPASQGFYDGSRIWSFIILGGEYEGCGIFNELSEYEKYSDEVDIILSNIEFIEY